MTFNIHLFHNTQPVWTPEGPGFSIRAGFNVNRWAVSVYLMLGSNEHWFGLGWW